MPINFEIIRAKRKKAGLTQADMAKRTGLTQPGYCRLESGTQGDRVTIGTIEAVAKALGVKVDALLAKGKK